MSCLVLSAVLLSFLAVPAAADSAGVDACVTAEYLISACAVALPQAASVEDDADCYCCDGDNYVGQEFGSCASYISASAPVYSEESSYMSIASAFCQSVSLDGFTCAGAVASPTPTSTGASRSSAAAGASRTASATPTATASGSETTEAPACTSAALILESCSSALPGYATMYDDQVASCVCYTSGTYTTAFDSYMVTCAKWFKTADPSEYASIQVLEGFCASYAPLASGYSGSFGPTESGSAFSLTSTLGTDTTGTPTTASTTAPATSPTTILTAGGTVTVTAQTTVTSAGANAGSHIVAGRFVAWVAAVLPVVVL